MPAPNLSAVRASSLAMRFAVDTDDGLVSSIKALVKPFGADSFPALFSGARRRGGGSEVALVSYEEKLPPHFHVSYDFGRSTLPIRSSFPRLDDLWAEFEARKITEEITCQVGFTYGKRNRRSVLRVPLRLFEGPGLPFDEIRGYRLVRLNKKVGESPVEYSVVVDWDEDQGLTHVVSFTVATLIAKQTPGTMLQRAAEISSTFLVEEGSNE